MIKHEYTILDIESSKKPVMFPWQESSYLSSVGIKTSDGTIKIWMFNPLQGNDVEHIREIRNYLLNSSLVVGHNIKFDLTWMLFLGIDVSSDVWCTYVGDYLFHGQRDKPRSLNDVAARAGLGQKLDFMSQYWNDGINTAEIPVDLHKEYLTQDLNLTEQVFLHQREQIRKAKLEKVAEMSFNMSKILAQVEFNGAPFSKEAADNYLSESVAEMALLENKLVEIAGVKFNPKSSHHLRAILYGGEIKWGKSTPQFDIETYEVVLKGGVIKQRTRKCDRIIQYEGMGFKAPDGAKTKTGQDSTGKEVIKKLHAKSKRQREFLECILRFSMIAKMRSTLSSGTDGDKGWLNILGKDGRLHGALNQCIAITGRLTSSNPNMQNLPRKGTSPLKRIFKAPERRVIVNADLAQIEWRIAAELSRDPVMLQELYDGEDIHTANAVQIFGADITHKDHPDKEIADAFDKIRTASKTVSFRLLYGGSWWGFYLDFRMPDFSKERWQEIVDNFYNKYKVFRQWQLNIQDEVRKNGYTRTPSGRIIVAGGTVDWADSKSIKSWQRELCNYPVQSFSFDVLGVMLYYLMPQVKDLDAKLIFVVHDAVTFECSRDDAEKLYNCIIDISSNLTKLVSEYFNINIAVPLFGDGELGPDYGTLTKIKGDNFKEVLASIEE